MQFLRGNNMTRVKESNQSAILRAIYYYGPISRAEIAQRIDLTIPTITTNINRMLEDGIVKECVIRGSAGGAGGRRARPLKIVPQALYFGGVEMKGDRLSVCVTDFSGAILASADSVLESGVYEDFVKKIADEFTRCVAAGKKKPEDLCGVGISMPGMVDREKGILKINARLQWTGKEVSRDFSALTGYRGKITLENNAIARGISAQLFHWDEMENEKSLAYLVVSVGIACPLFLNTSSYCGSVVGDGEVGHMVVEPHGRLCSCGNKGCLETYASETSIIHDCIEEMRRGRAGLLRQMCADPDAPEMAEIIRAQEAGDEDVRRIMENAIYMLGIAVTNIINFTNPDIMLIDSQLFKNPENRKLLLAHTRTSLCNKTYFKTVISFVESDQFVGALGAAAVAIDEKLAVVV